MSNPYKENSAQWHAWEKEQAERGYQTGTYVNQDELRKQSSGGGGGGGACFPQGSLVSTPFGKRGIETFEIGDLVLSWSSKQRAWEPVRVLKKIEHKGARKISKVTFGDGNTLRATPEHSVLTNRGWLRVAKLSPGDQLLCEGSDANLMSRRVASLSKSQDALVFNLVTEHHHNFVVDGAIAHNFTLFRSIRIAFWQLRTWFDAVQQNSPDSVAEARPQS